MHLTNQNDDPKRSGMTTEKKPTMSTIKIPRADYERLKSISKGEGKFIKKVIREAIEELEKKYPRHKLGETTTQSTPIEDSETIEYARDSMGKISLHQLEVLYKTAKIPTYKQAAGEELARRGLGVAG
jgi:hypothetical protein